ncbi:haloacid dehalogenase [Betaproteobacteria bacterium]|nr:haloacid dehalogenase [Betaproteobacteria bacterium]GHT99190.1 haloacid dehalogenase [Betaproteobacteria bacterium]GHU23100.1 haloacid dehalogenase [Betaproteobacteria bacterium]
MNLALFDLDNTLLAGDSDFAWGQFLITKNAVDPTLHDARHREFFADYNAGKLDMAAFLEFQLAPLAQFPRSQLDAWRKEYLSRIVRPMVTEAGRDRVRRHLANGDLVALVTATNAFVTAPIAREFGIHHLIATVPAQENGAFTGKVRGQPSFQHGKITRVEAWLESFALNLDSFAQSWFYSDSHNDLPLLERVTHPVAIDPDEILKAHALAHGWALSSFR